MRRILIPTLVGAALALGASRAGAQAAKLDRLEPRTRAAVVAVIDSAVDAGLPVPLVRSLVSVAQRGAAFGLASGAIVSRVRDQARHLQMARIGLGDSSIIDVESGAAALAAGVDHRTLVSLRRARPEPGSVAVALVVLADLITRGVPADTASGLILAVAGSRAGDQVWHELRTTVVQDISSGKTPLYAAEARTRGVLGAAAGSPAVTTEDTRGAPTGLTGGRPAGPPPPNP